jgi:hypothetical protein
MVENEREGMDVRVGFGWGAVAKEKKTGGEERGERKLYLCL